MKPQVIRTKDFAADATKFILDVARRSLGERNEFRMALSGGNTPRPVHAELARADLPWERVLITFGDERCVPPDDEPSLTLDEVLEDRLGASRVPCAYGLSIGHITQQVTVPVGIRARFDAGARTLTLLEPAVA